VITLIGLGAGDPDTLSRGAERALREASKAKKEGTGELFVRTARHPSAEILTEWGLAFRTFDALYETGRDFSEVYALMTEQVLSAAQKSADSLPPFSVAFAVPGHPLFGETSAQQIRQSAITLDIPIRIVSSGSFVEACLTSVGHALEEGCDVRDALLLREKDEISPTGFPTGGQIDSSRALLLMQVYDRAAASHTKLCLMRYYPDDWNLSVIRWAGVPGRENVETVPLYRLDRVEVDYLTSVFVPPLPPELRKPDFSTLVGLMSRLRAPDGCPWDREQTYQSLKKFFLEETYEVLEAIDEDNPELLCEELGDALLQVVFYAQLASETGDFDMDEVSAGIVRKLVRRHPHVFGEVDAEDSEAVLRNWEKIKREEKSDSPDWRKSILDGVPKGLPSLMAAQEVSKRVVKVGFEWNSFEEVLAKFAEETEELKQELAQPEINRDRVSSELGDLLFTVVQIARWQKVDAEEALRQMLTRFSRRFRFVETEVGKANKSLTEMTLEEMDVLWNAAKREEQKESV